jgi:beta-N-acetylhexosaminidase
MKKPAKWSMERFAELNEQIQDIRIAVLGEENAAILSVEDGKRSPVELY